MEDFSNLDHRMFARHPGGYLCRCGAAHQGKPQHCTCVSDFPEATMSDLSERIRELEHGIRSVLHDLSKWEPYTSRDTGEVFLADSVRDLMDELRGLLTESR